jgi:hypothetical protein
MDTSTSLPFRCPVCGAHLPSTGARCATCAGHRFAAADRLNELASRHHDGHHQHEDNATTILVLGILSLVVCTLLGPVVWHMSNATLTRMDMGQMSRRRRDTVLAGKVCGMIATAFLAFLAFAFLVMLGRTSH